MSTGRRSLAEYGFLGTLADLIEDLRNGMELHPAEGVSPELWDALTPEELVVAAGGEAIRYTTPQREREAQLVRTFQMSHRADGTVTEPPMDTPVTHALGNFGYAIVVSEGRAAGYMTLSDGFDDPATWNGVDHSFPNIWGAHAHRRSGVATAFPTSFSSGPTQRSHAWHGLSPRPALPGAGRASTSGTEPGRNDPCPCGPGSKYKRCCGATATLHPRNGCARRGGRARVLSHPGFRGDRVSWFSTS